MSSPPIASIRVQIAGRADQVFTLVAGETIDVGRSKSCNVVLDDKSASRVHARFEVTDRGLVVTDNNSTNGTFVNSGPLKESLLLKSGDIVHIGMVKIAVDYLQEEDDETLRLDANTAMGMTAQLRSIPMTTMVIGIIRYKEVVRKVDPHFLDAKLSAWRRDLVPIVTAAGGIIEKQEDAQILVNWVAGDARENALAAIKAAISIRKLNMTAPPMLRTSCVIISGVGIEGTTGDGSGGSCSFSHMGNPLEQAALLQDATASLGVEIVVLNDTVELLGEDYTANKVLECSLMEGDDPEVVFTIL